MELSPRLALAADFCTGSRRVIDVGCDHGYLCLELIRRGASEAVATDLREGPLAKAEENIRRAGLSHRVRTALRPGLDGAGPEDCDTVTVCGMGGELIAEILQKAPWTGDGAHRLVLQPMTRGERLRQWLAEHRYTVEREGLAREGRRLYVVMQARGGEDPDSCGRENFWLFTPHLAGDPLFPAYLAALEGRLRRAAEGKRRAGLFPAEEAAMLKRLEEWKGGAG